MAYPGRIVDAHHHLWDLESHVYPWLRDGFPHPMFGDNYDILRQTYLVEDFLRDIGDLPVRKSVHLQADYDTSDPIGETRWLNAVAEHPDSKGFPHAIIAYADLFSPEVEKVLEEQASFPRMCGIRQTLHHRENQPLRNPVWLENFKLLKKYDLTFDLQVYPPQLEDALRLVDKHPDMKFILSHCGLPRDLSLSGISRWKDAIVQFSKRDHVVCKMSGFGMLFHERTYGYVRFICEHIITNFGTKRCFFGSNYPADRFGGSYREFWDHVFELTSELSQSEVDDLYWNSAIATYRALQEPASIG